jgi:hypothetical protein
VSPLLRASFSLTTPHKEILPIKQVMEISPLRAVIATAQSVRLKRASVGSPPERKNFWRHVISMSYSPCRTNCTRSSCKTKPNFTDYCSVLSPTRS